MTEKEKAQSGLPYCARNDAEMIHDRLCAKDLCSDYNRLPLYDEEERNRILRKLLGNLGSESEILEPFQCDYGYNIRIGDNFTAYHNLVVIDSAAVTIGDNVIIGPNVELCCTIYPDDLESRNSGIEIAKPIKIGNNVRIGGNVCICPGITIGDGSIVENGSVVTQSVPEFTVVGGNPCRIIRKI